MASGHWDQQSYGNVPDGLQHLDYFHIYCHKEHTCNKWFSMEQVLLFGFLGGNFIHGNQNGYHVEEIQMFVKRRTAKRTDKTRKNESWDKISFAFDVKFGIYLWKFW